ncbi:beta-1,3-galactosyltransferase 5-like [Ylistrum balloti]|uniref:beta-1,3-galactosyltransferase 5-like n=1 Tax=Ylistrum balloti TaxID=509963 RepID=UPI002905817D|nr:beta-1,3-galactosyltransferase 5-like [Ylistrum balloti]
MGWQKRNILKVCENVFATFVVLACLFTLMTSLSSSKLYKKVRSSSGRKHGVLKEAKESFRMAMGTNLDDHDVKIGYTTPKRPEQKVDRPDPYVDPFHQWFRERNVVKYSAKGKHPVLPETEVINNKGVCKSDPVDILIYFQSRWDHFKRRSVLRETWASSKTFKDIQIKTIFVLGKSPVKEDQVKINNENLLYHDIIQGDFVDSIANLTMKSILAMKWINENCIQAKFILKADDDMFVNIFALIEYLISQIYEKNKVVMCHAKENDTSPIERNKNSKWYVPPNVFPGRKRFPRFCSGYTSIFTADLVPELYKASFSNPYFSVDDAYLFGLLMEKIKDVMFFDIQDNMTLNQKSALEEYTGGGAIEHVASNAWEDGALEKFWQATLSKLTKWSKTHANVAIVQQNRNDVMGR